MADEGIVVGRVTRLAHYPVKSMAGEETAELDLRWPCAHGDRQYALVRRGNRSRSLSVCPRARCRPSSSTALPTATLPIRGTPPWDVTSPRRVVRAKY